MSKIELLFPAGDFEKLKVGFHFGGDAVYIGLKDFSLRANAKNFCADDIEESISYTRKLGKKIFIAMNVYLMPDETDLFIEKLKFIEIIKPDGIIISDMGALYLARRYAPSIPIHISTQANTTNQYAAQTYKDLGVKRIVLARELTIPEIKKIKDTVKDIEIETFVHGAMCIAYSGRCVLSAYMTKEGAGRREKDKDIPIRSANRGDCSHSCRWEFILKEKSRPEQNYEIFENEEGSYILSSKDICMIDHIKDLIEAGVDSLKIEGRMKSILYISSITRAYRRAIDNFYDDKIIFDRDFFEKELNVVSHREFSTGFFYENPKNQANITESISYKREMRLGALVTGINGDRVVLKIYNKMTREDKIEYISNDMKTIKVKDITFYDKKGSPVEAVNHTQYVEAEIYDEDGKAISYKVNDILRMESSF